MIDVAVVGAGPYGLSIASHLRGLGIEHRIFGTPMNTWRNQMPRGMFLKSEGFASNIFDPSGSFTLRRYCAEHGLPYEDTGLPVRRDIFADYGVAFQQQHVPYLEPVDVDFIEQLQEGFRLTLATGESFRARRVVLSVGISHFARLPREVASLPPDRLSHSSRHADLSVFAGREMLVLGAGASALDCASLLVKAGASVRLVARAERIMFHERGPQQRSLLERIRAPMSGLGPGWRSRLCTDAPLLFHFMPEDFRLLVIRKHLGPAPGYWTRTLVEDKVDFHLGQTVLGANVRGGRVELAISGSGGTQRTLVGDHLIAATGYHPDIRRLGFLSEQIKAGLRLVADAPVLSRHFESSLPGLYFVGLAAANSFGPVERFAFGAGFTARRLSRHLSGQLPRRSSTRAFRQNQTQLQTEAVVACDREREAA